MTPKNLKIAIPYGAYYKKFVKANIYIFVNYNQICMSMINFPNKVFFNPPYMSLPRDLPWWSGSRLATP